MKNNRKSICLILIMVFLMTIFFINVTVVYALEINYLTNKNTYTISLEEKNKLFTRDDNLTNPVTLEKVNNAKISDYENYIEQVFEPGQNNSNKKIIDEQLFMIVPEEVFMNLANSDKDYSYIGVEYGYYVKNYANSNQYLVYLLNTEIKTLKGTGHIACKIMPLYYEMYTYKPSDNGDMVASLLYYTKSTGTASVVTGYHKYSTSVDLQIKDVNFGGNLLNTKHANIGDSWYDEQSKIEDDGMFFIGTDYKFQGKNFVGDDSWKDILELGYSALGFVPYLGTALSIVDMGFTLADIATDYGTIFKNNDNVNDANLKIDAITDKKGQITEYGNLIRNGVCRLETTMENPLLFDNDNSSYVEAIFYVSQTENWETKFIGNMSFDIVQVENNSCKEVSNIVSNFYEVDINKGEEKFTLRENEIQKVQPYANNEIEYEYTAIKSGKQQIELSCNCLNNEHTANCIATLEILTDKEVEYNSDKTSAIIEMLKGDTIRIKTSLKDKFTNANYLISAKYIPYNIENNSQCRINLNGIGDFSLVEFNNTLLGGYNINLTVSGRVIIKVYEKDKYDKQPLLEIPIDVNSDRVQVKNLAKFFDKKIYIFKVENLGINSDVSISISDATNLELDSKNTNITNEEVMYKIQPNSDCLFSIDMLNSVDRISLFNRQGTKLDFSYIKNLFSISLAGNETYYILLENNSGNASFNAMVNYDGLKVGNNSVINNGLSNQKIFTISSIYSDFIVNITCENAEVFVFEKNNIEKNLLVDGKICLNAGKTYYVHTTFLTENTAKINVNIDSKDAGNFYIEEKSGVFGEQGFDVIKYKPSKHGIYEIDANSLKYEIYNGDLTKLSNNTTFISGNTYYVKVYGQTNDIYNIKFNYVSNNINFYDFNVVENGVYLLDVGY